jgi:beta-phosphoglucomutase
MLADMKAVPFDLDDVITDTAKYHDLAWKRLADELGASFSEKGNERLKGVGRMRGLELRVRAPQPGLEAEGFAHVPPAWLRP